MIECALLCSLSCEEYKWKGGQVRREKVKLWKVEITKGKHAKGAIHSTINPLLIGVSKKTIARLSVRGDEDKKGGKKGG